jgi:TonB family protein
LAKAALTLIPRFVLAMPAGVDATSHDVLVELPFILDGTVDGATLPSAPEVAARTPVTVSYPAQAAADGYQYGLAVVSGIVDAAGGVTDCTAVREFPAGRGFGAAGCAVAGAWRVNLWQGGYAVVGGRFSTPVYMAASAAADRAGPTVQATIPSAKARYDYYPDRAARMGITGQVVLECVLSAKGELSDCFALSETPDDYGFAAAALRLALTGQLTAKPRLVDGAPVEEVVRAEVSFDNPQRIPTPSSER